MPGAPSSDKTFFGFDLHYTGKYCKNPKVSVAKLNINPARAITWFVGVTIYCTFFNNNSPPPRQFLCNKILLKKLATVREVLIEQIFELREPGLSGCIMYSYNWLFSRQNNNLQGKYLTGLLFTAKILLEATHFTSLYQGQITYKI